MSATANTAGGNRPTVAVVIPCYNHGAFLREAVASAQAQTYAPVTCIVVDDGSTDAQTRKVLGALQSEGVHVVSQTNAGLSAARNAGVGATDAAFFVPLDSDDRLHPAFIAQLLPPLLGDEQLGYCYSHVQFFGADNGSWACPAYDSDHLILENLSTATAVVRRSAFDRVAGYRTDMVHGFEDWDFWLALLAAGYRGRVVPEPLLYYRKHAPGASMLSRAMSKLPEMTRKMIEHHTALFRDKLFGGCDGARDADVETLYRELVAALELRRIEHARSWKMLSEWMPSDATNGPPSVRLAMLKQQPAYRMLAAIKRSPVYRWYARNRHGESTDPRLPAEWTLPEGEAMMGRRGDNR